MDRDLFDLDAVEGSIQQLKSVDAFLMGRGSYPPTPLRLLAVDRSPNGAVALRYAVSWVMSILPFTASGPERAA